MQSILFAVLILLAGYLHAQTAADAFDPGSDAALIAKGLQSTLPLQVAVCAYRAKQDSRLDSGRWRRQLRQALSGTLSMQPEAEAVRARGVILDALIQTRTQVPLEESLPFFDQFPAAVIAVVAGGEPRIEEDRLPLLAKAEATKNRAYWLAAAALTDRKQLLHYLAERVAFDYPIIVSDRDFIPLLMHADVPHGVIGGVLGDSPGSAPKKGQVNWPDQVQYELSLSGPGSELTCCVGGRTFLISSQDPLWAYRSRPIADPDAWDEHNREIVLILLSIAHCSICSRATPDFPRIRGEKGFLFWRSEDRARVALTKAVDEYVQECRALLETLGETGFSETDVRAKVRIWLQDVRWPQSVPLPAINVGVQMNNCAISSAPYCRK